MAFVNLVKAFARVMWWVICKLGAGSGWYASYRACMKMPETWCMLDATWVKNSLWIWVFTKPLACAPYCSSPFWSPLPRVCFLQDVWENISADDLVIISKSLMELQEKLILWKANMERKGLRVNMGKTNVLISGPGLTVIQKSVWKASAQTPFLWSPREI